MPVAIRETTVEAEYKTKQEFPSAQEAYQDKNPLNEIKTEVLDTNIINVKVKLKNETINNTDSNTAANNITNSK